MLRLISFAGAAALTACVSQPQPVIVTPEKQARLNQLLEGKAPGTPVTCISRMQADDMTVISDATVLFRDGGRRVFRNDFNGGRCTGLGSGFYAMQTRSFGSQLCRGDLVSVVDTRTGMMVGTCILGDFVPYTRPNA